jgi:hypothetical protein
MMRASFLAFAALGLAAMYACSIDTSVFEEDPNAVSNGGSSAGGSSGGTMVVDPNCPNQCKLVVQCGCPADEKCTVDSGGDTNCEDDGDVSFGQTCDDGDCEAGTICLPRDESPAVCKKFCNSHADCDGDGAFCTIDVLDDDDNIVASACTMDCDPIGGAMSGCPAPETKCIIRRANDAATIWGTDCVATGTSLQGQSCATSEDCAAGLVCTTTMQCVTLCDADAMPETLCPGGTACQSDPNNPLTVGSTTYGICF